VEFAKYRDAAYPADQIIDLKNERCPIMDGECDGESTMVFQNYRIQLCCDGCDKKFRKNPRKHLTLLLNPDLVALNNKNCPVMAEEPAEPDNFFVYDGVVIDTCGSDCPEMFAEEPARYLKKAGLDLAKLKAAAQSSERGD
jgi:YHS domain-containing protein